ncbi:hypothetical protein [Epilithonimonas hungarica]|uniref:Uncharacterized protein n=1 Tax=Epilithonimonas hungarica TaxID=454006 RepID=A0A1G7JUK7_9FLAO|nr:hypothetical protein [Epilithonimonas hungarica]SDF28572.1 hypothetical protein SAMN05421825_1486 [Epilithonimonas hungarica]
MKNIVLYSLLLWILSSCQKENIQAINKEASIENQGDLKENPLLLQPITSSIQTKEKTMSTLYGNSVAFEDAMKIDSVQYRKNAVLYEVTWQQKPDEVWFGGNIPKEIQSVERLIFDDNGNPVYQLYKGKNLQKVYSDAKASHLRTKYILSQIPAVSP